VTDRRSSLWLASREWERLQPLPKSPNISRKRTEKSGYSSFLYLSRSQILLVAADVYRPAAIDQLIKLGKRVEVEVFTIENETDAVKIVREGVDYGRKSEMDTIIVDTAGRLQVLLLPLYNIYL